MLLPLPSSPLPSSPPRLSVVELYGVWNFITTLSATSCRQSIPPPPSVPGITVIFMSPIWALPKSSSNFKFLRLKVYIIVWRWSWICAPSSVLSVDKVKLSLIFNVSYTPVVEFGAWKNHFDSA